MRKVFTVLLLSATAAMLIINYLAFTGRLPEIGLPSVFDSADHPPVEETEESVPIHDLPPEELTVMPDPEPFDADTAALVDEVMKKNRAVGASAAVIKDGNVAFHYEYGVMDKETGEAVTKDTKFRIASLSKVVTTMTAMTLVDSGKMGLDDDLSDVFGYRVRNSHYSSSPVTVRMLMTHTSSMYDRNPNYVGAVKTQLTNGSHFSSHRPGTRFSYCNFGMGILGAAVEMASGQKLCDYSEEALFDKMDIDASYLGSRLEHPELIANCYFRSSLNQSREELMKRTSDEAVGDTDHLAAGALLISSVDYAKLMTVLINDGKYCGRQILSPGAVSEMETPYIATKSFDQCLALRKSAALMDGHTMFYHNGNSYGILSFMCYDPEQRSGVVVVTSGSREYFDGRAYEVCMDAAKVCYGMID